jgi:hypothetical protein
MNHRFSWRLGLLVILIILGLFAWQYPNLIKNETVPVRQTSEIRSANDANDAAARRAIELDNAN